MTLEEYATKVAKGMMRLGFSQKESIDAVNHDKKLIEAAFERGQSVKDTTDFFDGMYGPPGSKAIERFKKAEKVRHEKRTIKQKKEGFLKRFFGKS